MPKIPLVIEQILPNNNDDDDVVNDNHNKKANIHRFGPLDLQALDKSLEKEISV